MLSLRAIGLALFGLTVSTMVPSQANAMNQEGHNDWMLDFPPGIEAFVAGPSQRPLPSRGCPVSAVILAANPYEQIPLPRHGCPPESIIGPLPEIASGTTK